MDFFEILETSGSRFITICPKFDLKFAKISNIWKIINYNKIKGPVMIVEDDSVTSDRYVINPLFYSHIINNISL